MPKKTAPPPTRGGTLVYIGQMKPNKAARPKAPPKSQPEEKTQLAARKKPSVPNPKKIEEVETPVREAPTTVAASPPQDPPAEDMMAHVQAARKRRAESQPQDPAMQSESAPQETENERANRIARENIAVSQNRAAGHPRGHTGGMFEIRNVGYRDAQFAFYGWSSNTHRDALQLISVKQGSEVDIQMAIIKRIIEIIREKKDGDFPWESQRLGRVVTLSARIEDTVGLQQFLMREFFPDYGPLATR